MFSLPIPDAAGTVCYDELSLKGHSFGKLVVDLKAKRRSKKEGKKCLSSTDWAHLDPDLISSLRHRKTGWRPVFGQCGKDATILRSHGVGKGDLFLFFGWFRRCALIEGTYRFLIGAPDLHVIFGYLKIGNVIRLSYDPVPEWIRDHPHLHGMARKADTGNTLFVAADDLGLPGSEGMPGACAFTRVVRDIQLSAFGMSRSWWELPKWFYPKPGTPSLSSHGNADRWRLSSDSCLLQSVARGQEFILDVSYYPESIAWVTDLIRCGLEAVKNTRKE